MTVVKKFGGSVLREERDIVSITRAVEDECVLVLSAFSGLTDMIAEAVDISAGGRETPDVLSRIERFLAPFEERDYQSYLKMLRHHCEGVRLIGECPPSVRDRLLALGERITARIASAVLSRNGVRCKYVDAADTGLITDGIFGRASIDLEMSSARIGRYLQSLIEEGIVPVVPGFFGVDRKGRINTLGKGGSDYTATALGCILSASRVELWKDVEGFYTADPRVVDTARTLRHLSYDEAGEMAYFGAEILHPRAIGPAKLGGIPIHIVNFDSAHTGSIIDRREGEESVKAVAFTRDVAVLYIRGYGVGYKPGILGSICSALYHRDINIKSVVTSQTCISLLLERKDMEVAADILEDLNMDVVSGIESSADVAIVSLIGDRIIATKGIAARAFSAVAREGINVRMISAGASNSAYYFIVPEEYVEMCVRAIHREFFE